MPAPTCRWLRTFSANVVTARSEEAIISALYLVGLLASPELPPFV